MKSLTCDFPELAAHGISAKWQKEVRRNQAQSNKEPRESKGSGIFPTFHSLGPNNQYRKFSLSVFQVSPVSIVLPLFFFFLFFNLQGGRREEMLHFFTPA